MENVGATFIKPYGLGFLLITTFLNDRSDRGGLTLADSSIIPDDLRAVIREITIRIEKHVEIRLSVKARERLQEGILHAIRATFFSTLLDMNFLRFEKQPRGHITLQGKWQQVSSRAIDHLPILLKRETRLRTTSVHDRLAKELEEQFHLSKYIPLILSSDNGYKSLAEFVISIESAFLERARDTHRRKGEGKRRGDDELTEEEMEKAENEEGKWFG